MKVYLNSKEIELENNSNLLLLLEQSNIIKPGIAVAVNNFVIPKAQWDNCLLNDNDKITIIKAVSGG
ncbi:MAG: sulfur carrier protein ThiS [Bacteroidetes bacterium]|nr:sulfur carrier protein ThiS [Bacteroidota bacterium]